MAKIKLDKLKKEIADKYNDSAIGGLAKFKKERQKILGGFAESFPLESTISDFQDILNSSALQGAFKTIDDYKNYANPLLSGIKNKDYLSLQRELEKPFAPYIKTEVQGAIEALGYTEKSLSELSKNMYLDADKYGADIGSALKDMGVNSNLLMSAKTLTESMKKIETEMFQDEMEKLNERRLEVPRIIEPIKISENPMIKQNRQIIELLDLQNETLLLVGGYISSQNEKLDTQNKFIEEEIKDNKKAAKQAFWTAAISIFIAIAATIWATWASYDIYGKEDKSGNMQHAELMRSVGKNNNPDLLKKQTKVLNKILKSMELQNSNSKKLYKKISEERNRE